MRSWLVLGLLAMAACTYLEERAACNAACEDLFAADGCDISTEDAGVGENTATFACTQTCADREPETRDAFLDCVNGSTCEDLEAGTCDFEELAGRSL